jgi:hypothetical protein
MLLGTKLHYRWRKPFLTDVICKTLIAFNLQDKCMIDPGKRHSRRKSRVGNSSRNPDTGRLFETDRAIESISSCFYYSCRTFWGDHNWERD